MFKHAINYLYFICMCIFSIQVVYSEGVKFGLPIIIIIIPKASSKNFLLVIEGLY